MGVRKSPVQSAVGGVYSLPFSDEKGQGYPEMTKLVVTNTRVLRYELINSDTKFVTRNVQRCHLGSCLTKRAALSLRSQKERITA